MTVRKAFFIAAAGLASGCATPPVDVTFGGSDTVVVNGSDPAAITLEARDASGAESALEKATFSYVSGDRLWLTKKGVVECDRPGTMQFAVSTRGFSKRMTLLCRPIRGFANPRSVHLLVGGPGEELPINPVGIERGLEVQFRAKVTLADTGIAAIQKGKVFPRSIGETYADVQVGDCVLRIAVVVTGRAASLEAIRPYEAFASREVLTASATPTWTIPAGRYRFYPGEGSRLSGTGLNCAAIERGLSCVSKPGATLTLHRAAAGPGADTVRLLVERLSDTPLGVSSAARHVSGRSRENDRCMNYMGGFASR